MNRKRLIILLAVLLPLVIFGAAKWAARWRPVRIAEIAGADTISEASDRYVVTRNSRGSKILFDLQTGAVRRMANEGIAARGAWTWQLVNADKEQLRLMLRQNDGPIASYVVPTDFGRGVQELSPDCVRVSPVENRLELLLAERYFRWNLKSRRLEREVETAPLIAATIARDGESIVNATFEQIEVISTRNKPFTRIVPLQKVTTFGYWRVSPFRFYALHNAPGRPGAPLFKVVNAQTGRAKWQVEIENLDDQVAFSPDEKLFALPFTRRKVWQMRDAETGKLIRILPLMPGAISGAFSPDNSTLYSVADGVLYRQRAR